MTLAKKIFIDNAQIHRTFVRMTYPTVASGVMKVGLDLDRAKIVTGRGPAPRFWPPEAQVDPHKKFGGHHCIILSVLLLLPVYSC